VPAEPPPVAPPRGGRRWRAGFPLLTSYALTQTPASHGAVVIGLLPAATALMAVLRGNERVGGTFWLFAALGGVAVVTFVGLRNGGLHSPHGADLLLFAAVLAAAVGYAEGGLLARELGAWQTVSWALVLAAPLMLLLPGISIAQATPSATGMQWLAFGYLAVVSMFLGFFAWYRGLAIGPMAQVSQVQLVQPVLSILWGLFGVERGGALALPGCSRGSGDRDVGHDAPLVVAEVAEAAGDTLDVLDNPVEALGAGVGHPELQEDEDVRPPRFHGGGQTGGLGRVGGGAGVVEAPQAAPDLARVSGRPGGGAEGEELGGGVPCSPRPRRSRWWGHHQPGRG